MRLADLQEAIEPRKRYIIRLSHTAYSAAERDSLSGESHLVRRADIFMHLLNINRSEGLTKRQFKWLRKQQGHYLMREKEFKAIGGYNYDD